MKKITALLLCFFLLCTCSVTAFAAQPENGSSTAVISVTVPNTHKITVTAESAEVFYEGISGEEFTVARLSEPRLLIRPESGKVIQAVIVNGENMTDLLDGGYLDLAPVYEDQVIRVITENASSRFKGSYFVKGTVTLNGQPLADVDLELRSTLMSTKTDENGQFVFSHVEPGHHSLTALKDGKVIGYLSFILQNDSRTHVSLLSDGTYIVSVDQNGAGVELHLVLNEEKGILAPTDVKTVQKGSPDTPQTGGNTNLSLWWLLLILSGTCIVVLETYRRKKTVK